MVCAADNYSYMCHVCAKVFLDLNFNWAFIDKISIFSQNCPKFQILTKKKYCKEIDQLLLPYKFYNRDMSKSSFSFLAVVSH